MTQGRRESRSNVRLKVEVRGKDAQGNPFVQTAYATDTSYYGARIDGIECLRGPGDVVQVKHKGKSSRLRVVWVGQLGSKEHGHIGLQNLEPRKNIWNVKQVPSAKSQPLADRVHSLAGTAPQRDSSESAKAATPNEKRKFTRHRCLGNAEFRIAGNYTKLSGKLTDVSLGGCYIQALGTCLVGTLLDLELEACGLKISLGGRVVVAASSQGMGVEFVPGCEGLKQLPKFVDAVRRRYAAATRPAVEVRGKQTRPL